MKLIEIGPLLKLDSMTGSSSVWEDSRSCFNRRKNWVLEKNKNQVKIVLSQLYNDKHEADDDQNTLRDSINSAKTNF